MEYASGEYNDDYFFQYFKMKLHKDFDDDPMIRAYNNKELPLSIILKQSFMHIKDKMIETLHMRRIINNKNANDITWVLTVPAIWSDAAKAIMRRAAFDGN